jgi:hypothetical protein
MKVKKPSLKTGFSPYPPACKPSGLEAGTGSDRKLVDDLQQMQTVGNGVIIIANKALDSIDALVSRFSLFPEIEQGTEPIDIAEYRGTAKDFTETAGKANLPIQSLNWLAILQGGIYV